METRKRSSLSSAYRDRLSNLPEPLIHHILSFMDMKYVTCTTILSRRWRNLWYSLPFLSFDADVFQSCLMHASEDYRYKEFSDFVYMVLLVRDGSPIQSIHLSLKDLSSKLIHIDQWIRTAVLRNVKEIHVELDFKVAICELLVDLPDCLVTSKSLTSLKLCLLDEPCHYTMQVKLADKICLPSLKTLHMELLDLSAYDNFFDVLFLGCPALEKLVLVKCEFTVSKVLTISSLHLKHLLIDLNYGGNESLEVFVIHASNLLEYCWKGTSRSAFSLVGLSSLETANIDHGECYDVSNCKKLLPIDAENAKSMMECLKGLYNVKHLTLSNDCLQLISELPSELEKWPTVFSNLRFLNLQTWLTRGCFEVTMLLLKNSPNIETLVLHMDPLVSEETIELGVQSSSDLKLHHLKVVKLLEVGGCKMNFSI